VAQGAAHPRNHHKDKQAHQHHHQVQNQILVRTSASSLCQTDRQTSNSGARKPIPTPVDSVRAMRTLSSRRSRRLPAAGGEAREPCERRWRGSARRRGRDEEAANEEGRGEVEVRAPATDRDMALAALLLGYTPSVCGCGFAWEGNCLHPMPPPLEPCLVPKIFKKRTALSFVCDKYCPIID